MAKHPKELWILSLSELCERFAFWGVGNLLVLYLIEHYQLPNAEATSVYAIFSGAATFLPFLGGFVADRWNYQSPLIWGAVLNAIGCFILASGVENLLYVALFIIACGYGIFTPSIVTALGHAYRKIPRLRESGFSIYYASINIGVFLALASLGIVSKLYSWSLAFALAGSVQLLGLIPLTLYLLFYKKHYSELKEIQKSAAKSKEPLSRIDKDRLFVLFTACIASILFWIAYNQAYSSMEIFAHDYMDRTVLNMDIPEGLFLSSEPFFLILLAPLLAALYKWLQKIGKDPLPMIKTAFGLFAISSCFILMMIASSHIPAGAHSASIPSIYLIGAYFLMAVGEMLLAPIGLSLMSRLAPERFKAFGVGIWYLCVGVAFYIGGNLASLMGRIDSLYHFFAIFVLLTVLPGVCLLFLSRKLAKYAHWEKK